MGTRQVNQLGRARAELGADWRRQQRAGSWSSSSAARRRPCSSRRSANTHYNALQTRLSRAFQQRLLVQRQLHAVASDGTCGGAEQRQPAARPDPGYVRLEHGVSRLRPHARAERRAASRNCRSGEGRRWLNKAGLLSAIVGGWQLNNILSLRSGTPFTVTTSTTPLNAPGASRRIRPTRSRMKWRSLGGVGDGNS